MSIPEPSNDLEPQGEPLDVLLTVTRRLEAQAEAGEWDSVIELERERRPLVQRAFATPPATAQLATVEAIATIQRRLIAAARRRHTEVSAELETLEKGRRATAAYAGNLR